MSSAKLLVSLPESLASRWRAAVPARKRSEVLRELIKEEIHRREKALYECAKQVENDQKLNKEIENWDITSSDGIDDESW